MSAPPLRVILDQEIESDAERRLDVLRTLLEGGYGVTLTGEAGGVAPADESELLVLRESQDAGEVEASEGDLQVRTESIEGLEADAVLELVRETGREARPEAREPGDWTPWFPVIDYDRCTNCMQCLSFCLFGVYDVDNEKQIEVREPEKCKTNCPACSRVCPEVAILFPKYKAGPINGDVVNDQDVEREKMKTDISSLLGGDIYALLRQRHEHAASRFSKERDDERALKERQRCLKKLQADLDIPPELLAELPSAEQIQERFAERLAKKDQ